MRGKHRKCKTLWAGSVLVGVVLAGSTSGCDRPEISPHEYGTRIDHFPAPPPDAVLPSIPEEADPNCPITQREEALRRAE